MSLDATRLLGGLHANKFDTQKTKTLTEVSAVVQWDLQTNTQKQPAQSDM